jgi:hypothetical protein
VEQLSLELLVSSRLMTFSALGGVPQLHKTSVGLARTIYIRCIYGNFGREITKYTVKYGVYIRFWPTLMMTCACVHVFMHAWFTCAQDGLFVCA